MRALWCINYNQKAGANPLQSSRGVRDMEVRIGEFSFFVILF